MLISTALLLLVFIVLTCIALVLNTCNITLNVKIMWAVNDGLKLHKCCK